MASEAPRRAVQIGRDRTTGRHDGFLRHKDFLWLKIAVGVSLVSLLIYMFIDPQPRHNGGTWYGYLLGTIGAGLILWLTMLGVRKRAMTTGKWSLKTWTSAHVYLGLSLIFIGTLHTGFQFGWNVHTLAYTLMMIVIISGIFGVIAYANVPQSMSANRAEMTEKQMLESIRSIDRQLHEAAQPLDTTNADLVRQSLDQDPFGGGIIRRLSGVYPNCATRYAQAEIRRETAYKPRIDDDPLEKIDALLTRKEAMLGRVRNHLRLKALLEVWLYFHVPITFALIAALLAHIISVFFYW
jgi:hypothetical protein